MVNIEAASIIAPLTKNIRRAQYTHVNHMLIKQLRS